MKEYTFQDFLTNVPLLKDKNNLGQGKQIKGFVKTDGGAIPLNKGYVTVMFYADWCGHCHDLAPKYTKAFYPIRHTTLMCRVDCTSPECEKLTQRFEIHGYPTILRFKDGKMVDDYNGNRQPFELMCFANGLDNLDECSAKYPTIRDELNN